MSKPSTFLAHLAAIGANLIYAANYVIAKEVTPVFIKPLGLVLIRVWVALFMFWIVHSLFVREKVERKDFFKLALASIFGIAINQMMFIKGLSMTSPINASLLMITTPIIVLVLAFFLINEKLGLGKILGIALGALGAALIVLSNNSTGANDGNLTGDLFIVINAASYALYFVLIKPLLNKYHPITIVKWIFTFGALIVLPFGWTQFNTIDWAAMPRYVYYATAYVVIATTFFAYLLNSIGLKKLNASVVGAYIYTQPIIASAIAVFLGKGVLTPEKLGSAVLIFAGVYLVSVRK